MAVYTYRDLITRSLRLIGAIANVQTPSGTQSSQGLEVLKEIIDSWNGSSLMLYSNSYSTFAFVNGQSTYTVGPTGDWSMTARPVRIDAAWNRNTSSSPNTDLAMTELSASEYGDITQKTTSQQLPFYFNYDPSFPNGTIKVYPVPTSANISMVILTQDGVDNTITLNTTFSLPPAYRQALVYNLAVALGPEYGIEVPPSVTNIALTAKQTIMNNNFESEEMSFDFGSGSKFNINTGFNNP